MVPAKRARTQLASLLLLLVCAHAHAADKLRLERIDLTKSPTCKMYLSYLDSDGRVLTGRVKEEFKIILDSAEQGSAAQLTTFEQTTEPINVVALVQVSQAMLEVADEVKKGVKVLANAVPPKSKVAVIGFSQDTKRLAELGPPGDAESAANSLVTDTEWVEVHLLDAVRTGIDVLTAAPKDQRKLLVLFSDGIDVNMEKKAFFTLGKRAQEAGVVIDAIGYAPYEPARLRNLSELTKQSAGGERACKGPGEITTEFNNVADEIRRQYIATYELALAGGDGKFHTFQNLVDWAGRSAYSNNIIRPVPPATHPIVVKRDGRRWGLWAGGILGGLAVLMLIAWLIFREREEEPLPMPSVGPQDSGAPRTMAFDAGAGNKGVVMGWIVVITGRLTDKTFKLKSVTGTRTVIGSASECDVVIDDQFMSSRHCEVRFEGNMFRLVDLGSTNGMVVNDKKVREHDLVDNDHVKLGKTEFKFKSLVM
jgi:hypothetical protein